MAIKYKVQNIDEMMELVDVVRKIFDRQAQSEAEKSGGFMVVAFENGKVANTLLFEDEEDIIDDFDWKPFFNVGIEIMPQSNRSIVNGI